MYHIKDDVRQKKSADLLVASAMHLLENPDNLPLSIAAICKDSGISRSTFYRLFDKPDDVLRLYADRFYQDVLDECAGRTKRNDEYSPAAIYAKHFGAHEEEVYNLLRAGKLHLLMDGHRKALFGHAPVLFPKMDVHSDEFNFFVEIRCGIVIGVLRGWFHSGRQASLDDVIRYSEETMKYIR